MKKILICLSVFIVLTSCSIDDNSNPNFFLEVMPIVSVDIPTEFTFGAIHEISMTYNRPNTCYLFNDFIYEANINERSVAIVNTVYTDATCTELDEEVEVSFDFRVNSLETYIFRFYQGTDEEGEDQYYIIEVPVVE